MTIEPKHAIILWDVDHTLVTIKGVSRRIYEAAFLQVTGQPLHELADMTGRTERRIVLDTLKLHGIEGTDELCEQMYAALGTEADKRREEMATHGQVLAGAAGAIAGLAGDGVVQTVVTGNVEAIAKAKLEVFGLADSIDFTVGGYGSDGYERAPLIFTAMDRAAKKYGHSFALDRVVVVGDTPYDVAGARDAGVRAIAVATGGSSFEELQATGADAVLHDLTNIAAVRQAVLGVDR